MSSRWIYSGTPSRLCRDPKSFGPEVHLPLRPCCRSAHQETVDRQPRGRCLARHLRSTVVRLPWRQTGLEAVRADRAIPGAHFWNSARALTQKCRTDSAPVEGRRSARPDLQIERLALAGVGCRVRHAQVAATRIPESPTIPARELFEQSTPASSEQAENSKSCGNPLP